MRRHREWLGTVQPNPGDAVIGRSGGGDLKSGNGGIGACFDSDGAKRRLPFACINLGPGHVQPKCAFSARGITTWRDITAVVHDLLSGGQTLCSVMYLQAASTCEAPGQTYKVSISVSCRKGLDELYAGNRKRQRLVYALRRRQSDRCPLHGILSMHCALHF